MFGFRPRDSEARGITVLAFRRHQFCPRGNDVAGRPSCEGERSGRRIACALAVGGVPTTRSRLAQLGSKRQGGNSSSMGTRDERRRIYGSAPATGRALHSQPPTTISISLPRTLDGAKRKGATYLATPLHRSAARPLGMSETEAEASGRSSSQARLHVAPAPAKKATRAAS